MGEWEVRDAQLTGSAIGNSLYHPLPQVVLTVSNGVPDF